MVSVIKLRRSKGWRMPPNTVNVARPTTWGNPFGDAETFKAWLDGRNPRPDLEQRLIILQNRLEELRGKNLACWCHEWDGQGVNPMVCHADVLLEVANGQN